MKSFLEMLSFMNAIKIVKYEKTSSNFLPISKVHFNDQSSGIEDFFSNATVGIVQIKWRFPQCSKRWRILCRCSVCGLIKKMRNPSLMLSGSHWSWCQAIAAAEITGAGPDKILFVSVKMEHGDLWGWRVRRVSLSDHFLPLPVNCWLFTTDISKTSSEQCSWWLFNTSMPSIFSGKVLYKST